uniref:Uncharacterized protein n=1 Tax=Anguilla anguilla TaxID=7936 RepID=A0A0E9QNM5_ANGAN
MKLHCLKLVLPRLFYTLYLICP